jgi:hypothetical protein
MKSPSSRQAMLIQRIAARKTDQLEFGRANHFDKRLFEYFTHCSAFTQAELGGVQSGELPPKGNEPPILCIRVLNGDGARALPSAELVDLSLVGPNRLDGLGGCLRFPRRGGGEVWVVADPFKQSGRGGHNNTDDPVSEVPNIVSPYALSAFRS